MFARCFPVARSLSSASAPDFERRALVFSRRAFVF